jgi:glycosyltransferase involved in cell wall biosynthesis
MTAAPEPIDGEIQPLAVRLGVFVDVAYRKDADGFSADRAFVRFLLALRPYVDELVLIGRVDPKPGRASYPIPPDVAVLPLPHYPSLRNLTSVARALPATFGAIWAGLGKLDVVLSFGPHPSSIPVSVFGKARGKTVVLGVRQHFPDYVRHRLPGPSWKPLVGVAWGLESTFRALSLALPTVAVGTDLARRYGRGRTRALPLAISLVSEDEVRGLDDIDVAIDASRPVQLLSVGRLDPEKAPELLVEMMSILDGRMPGRFCLTVVGTGLLEKELRRAALQFGERIRFLGYVDHGPRLLDVYRSSDVFVHTARTEGLPQVLIEAQSQALPIVATDVGGVRAALKDGDGGLLVRPGSAEALASAVQTIVDDPTLRERLARRGVERARGLTLDRQAARLALFIAEVVNRRLGA